MQQDNDTESPPAPSGSLVLYYLDGVGYLYAVRLGYIQRIDSVLEPVYVLVLELPYRVSRFLDENTVPHVYGIELHPVLIHRGALCRLHRNIHMSGTARRSQDSQKQQ